MPGPVWTWKAYRLVTRLVGLFQSATASYERTHVMSKSLFVSKTFWFNVFTTAAEGLQLLTQVHVVPPGALAIAGGIINIGLRLVTDQPVHVVAPE